MIGPVLAPLSNVRHALRSLRRAPAFTLAAVATLALGIGANTAIFSIVNSVLLDPLGYPDPDRLVIVWGRHTTIGQETVSLPDFLDWRREARSFETLAAITHTGFNVTGSGDPEVVRGALTTAGLFHAFGVVPSVGRQGSLLFGVGAGDPATFVAVTFFLVAVALGSIYLPARRAARSDPMVALRND